MLPGLDDGAPDVETALAMAEIAAADGVTTVACTPHIMAGVYDNEGPKIAAAASALGERVAEAGIALELVTGADINLAADLLPGLRCGRLPTLNGSRYFLLEPPHHVAPMRLEQIVFSLTVAGYVPLITHPERLRWIEDHYETFSGLVRAGALMQLTGGSLLGRFGERPRYWAERMLVEGMAHVLASDGHGASSRRPVLGEASAAAARLVGGEEAERLVLHRPRAILDDAPPATLSAPAPAPREAPAQKLRRRAFFDVF
jgi:protein-tyrosine phosphatase